MQPQNSKSTTSSTKKVRGRKSGTLLPRYMLAKTIKNGSVYYYSSVVIDGKRKQISLGSCLESALSQHEEYVRAYYGEVDIKRKVRPTVEFAETLYKKLVNNARTRNIYVGVSLEDIQDILVKSEYKCELTGIHFDMQKRSNFRIRPWIPSIDRIDSKKGYTVDNCRVVCAAVNSALGQYGEEVLLKIAKMMLEKRKLNAGKRRKQQEE